MSEQAAAPGRRRRTGGRDRSAEVDPAYRETFSGLLQFADFAAAEQTLSSLEELRVRFRDSGDARGMMVCRHVGLRGRRRSAGIAANPRVHPELRRQKAEIASWFAVWLETPEIFADWLELRKASEEFRALAPAAGPGDGREAESTSEQHVDR
jgi:hypothetical protein